MIGSIFSFSVASSRTLYPYELKYDFFQCTLLRNNVLVKKSGKKLPDDQDIGLQKHNEVETSNILCLEPSSDEDRISRTSMYLSIEILIIVFEKMQQIAFSNTRDCMQNEALSIMSLTLMASKPSDREK